MDANSVNHSDATTEDYAYARSEDIRKLPSASPLLLKLKHKNWARSPAAFFRKGSQKEVSSYSYNTHVIFDWRDATKNDGVDGEGEDDEHLDLPIFVIY
ncbi:unnamed protein product [Linum trigynum]|uniref:Uncharacterized protein n=1 Tax=Linum trigynum TaxID=586398 RepID=A0AAV2FUT9_9ROSI